MSPNRFAINDAAADWSAAKTQVTKVAHSQAGATVVSVKSSGISAGQKRKADGEEGEKKATRRGKKVKR
ncbi:hypothetical protein BS17DRAFT_773162 [Gyrodon lividus]|nr:hypothetical protein BS17DRAFT_773162 [Gyrodon lividus]